ncbi:MAG: S-layer homology domain-containing protein [Clostridia bacterium]|nr:S-layer homology domain-containing protein [Clostridia bacterium]
MDLLKRRVLSGTIALSALLSIAAPASAAIPSDVKGTRYEEPVQILSALKIMVGDENGEFRLDDTIIRSEVTKMAVHVLGLEDAAESAKGQTMFDDVSTDHWANGYINLAVSQGIIEGDGDGNFRPNAPITYAEAMTIMVRATGYTVSAEGKGGYPQGYIQVATSNGLTKNVQGSSAEEISRGNVAYLTTNALESRLMEQTGFGSGASYEITDKTLLKDYLKVTKDSGQIIAIENTSLSGSSNLGKNQIKIGDKIYDAAYNMNDLLGYNVEYYVKEYKDGSNELILAMPIKNKNNELIIGADLFSKLTTKNNNTAIEYYSSESSSKVSSAELDKNAVLIYNGKYEDMDTDLLDMSDKSGSITLLDTNKDSKYDIAFVKSYENIVVDSATSNKISDKYSETILKLDDNVDYRITKGLEEISISDLNEYDVLSVYASLDDKLYDIAVTSKKIEGRVSGKDSNGFIIIDGEKYKVAPNYTNTISVGTDGVFYLDIDGRIAATTAASNLSSNYGYLTRAYYSKNTDEKASFKIFTMDNKEVTFEGTDKIKFNSVRNVSAEEVVNTINGENNSTSAQLITYAVNSDNKITAINTAVDNSSTGAVNNNKFTLNYSLSNAKFSKSLSKLGNVRIDSETVVFDVSGDNSVRNADMFEDGQVYDALIYDMADNYTAKAVVVTKTQLSASADAPIAVVKEIMSASNSDDEQTDMLVALVDGKEVSVYAENENVLVKGGNKLEMGDIIQYKTNSDDEIVSVRLLLDINDKDNEMIASPDKDLETVYGKVTKKFTNSINVTVNGGSAANYAIPSDVTVYSVDMTKSKNNILTAKVSDIEVYDKDENNRVFLKIYDDVVEEIVIIK